MNKKIDKKLKKTEAIAPTDPLQRYLQEVHSYPILSKEEEDSLVERYRNQGDVEAARSLVKAHLRLVAKIAMQYRSAYQNILDLIQEGNVGLLKAVKQFNPEKGSRFGYYAQWWIRSYVLKFIIDNFRLVKIGTTKAQKKIFYNLVKEKQKIETMGFEPTADFLSSQLGVGKKDLVEMQQRLGASELALEAPVGNKEEGEGATLGDFIPTKEEAVDEQLGARQEHDLLKEKFEEFAQTLSERDLKIFEERLLAELPLTLQQIADEFGITKERVRQLESRVVGNLKDFFKESGVDVDSILGS